jgi:hypothetical protein
MTHTQWSKSMRVYDTYRFKDKDPVIDIARTCVDIFASTNGIKFTKALNVLSKASGVSVGCMNGWFYGVTRRPLFCSVVAVVYATGRTVTVGDKELTSKPRFKSIKGGRAA